MDLFEHLLTSSSPRSVSPETLELLGTKASNLFFEKKSSLNDAIVTLASEHGEFTNEHIHRIAEFANNVTFQRMFEKNASKNIHFQVADPAVIIRDLKDGGSPAHDGKVLHTKGDYHRRPIREKEKSNFADPDSAMQDMFRREDSSGRFGQGETIDKVAHAAGLDPSWEGSANPVNDVYADHIKLNRAREEIVAEHEASDLMMKTARADFYRAVKTEVMSEKGAGLGGVISVFEKIAGARFHKELDGVVRGLMKDGLTPESLERSMRKTAGVVINQEHLLVMSLDGLIKASEHRSATERALKEVDTCLEKTASFLRAQMHQ
jgi:hypothetical protein